MSIGPSAVAVRTNNLGSARRSDLAQYKLAPLAFPFAPRHSADLPRMPVTWISANQTVGHQAFSHCS